MRVDMKNTQFFIKSVDQIVQGTALVDDAELQFVADANSVWALHLDLINSADDVADQNDRVQMAIKAPASAVVTVYTFAIVNDGTNGVTAPAQGPLVPASQGTPGSPFAWVRMAVLVKMGADLGPIGLQFGEVTSASANGAVVYAGSTLLARKAS